MNTLTRGSAMSDIRIHNRGLAVATVSGLVVPGAALALATGSADIAAAAGATAVLYRMEHAVSACLLDQLPKYDDFSEAGQALPAALVVSADNLAVFAAYCRRAGQGGMIRRAFTDAERAQAWLEAQQRMLAVTMSMRYGRAPRKAPYTRP